MLANSIRIPNFTGFQQLSKTNQLILANCLFTGNPNVSLRARDANGDVLLQLGWLVEVPSMTLDTRTYSIPQEKWRQLQATKGQILTPGLMNELTHYRNARPELFLNASRI